MRKEVQNTKSTSMELQLQGSGCTEEATCTVV